MSKIKKRMYFIGIIFISIFFSVVGNKVEGAYLPGDNNKMDFSTSVIMTSDTLDVTEKAAVDMLIDEIFERTRIKLKTTSNWPDTDIPVIVIGNMANDPNIPDEISEIRNLNNDQKADGFSIELLQRNSKAPVIKIRGNDKRGMLFGIGYFLRKSFLIPVQGNSEGKLYVPTSISVTTTPLIPMRGHQLGYRPKTNAYDGMTEKMWESYIRDLIVFGTNTIELMPPNTDDAAEGPMFFLPQIDMMVVMDKIIEKYGLDAWIWYPMMYKDYTNKTDIENSLEENRKIFSMLPKIDAVFVPGGDPGHTPARAMFAYLEKQAKLLNQYHPNAKIWLSPQGFDNDNLKIFFEILKEKPVYIGGIVYGPQVGMTLSELRNKVPSEYPIRRYPDITHNYASQYPVPEWDFAYAATENRESINPRPTQQKMIFNYVDRKDYYGFCTYSEGLNDDVNKVIWSGLGWNPDADVLDILRDYSRYFIGYDFTDDFAQGLMDLEKNWEGALINNSSVPVTLLKFKQMERLAAPRQILNWRFQQALYRAYYDAYVHDRLIFETGLESDALSVLRNAKYTGSLLAIKKATNVLNKAVENPVSQDFKNRIFELAEALFQSTHMQKSVEKYFAIGVRRGANLDLIDYPLNNRFWLESQFDRIKKLENERERLGALNEIVNWENPGPGGFYDDLGSLTRHSHFVKKDEMYNEDPGFLKHPYIGYITGGFTYDGGGTKQLRVSWQRFGQTFYDEPLSLRYEDLDPNAEYSVKVLFSGDNFKAKIQLLANDSITIHPFIKRTPFEPITFKIPKRAYAQGNLNLTWMPEKGVGGNGRSIQIGEVWLIKNND